MRKSSKNLGLLFLAVALISIILLATSLLNLQLLPGTPFPSSSISDSAVLSASPLPSIQIYSLPLLRGVFALIFVVFLAYLSARLIVYVNPIKILKMVVTLAILLVVLYMLPRITSNQPARIPGEIIEMPLLPTFIYPVTPLGQPPQILIDFVIIGIVLGIGLFVIIILKQWRSESIVENDLLQKAEEAVNALNDGMDLKNVIIRCYLQMTRSLQVEKGLERDHTMTVREFERWLEVEGFPTVPVYQLTYLFEKVRYGKQEIDKDDEKIAMNSLNEIIRYCRSGRV